MNKHIEHDLVAERVATIVRAIKSGDNECGTLMCGGKLNLDFVAGAVRPTIAICIDEADQLRRENAALRKDIEAKRFALESVIANNGSIAASIDALRGAMPGHPHLN